ncbi:GNAT family N-acetyltransferase [Cerasibacillus terrae]|uniref:GNAT family N-acetyltransferase n=1 Tax=Cerasibacillus terrae TaxID=2498845 RepID=A0A5C8NMN5_9BACI|nr:GNAT family N-acetyltransferase [Cerasibacillus terrae]TXL61733.1 GNAT family N-acetyltransferase [Cerasibacillus terrae]
MSFAFKTNQFANSIVRKATEKDIYPIFQMLHDIAVILEQKGICQWTNFLEKEAITEVRAGVLANTTYIVEDKQNKLVATFNYSNKQNDWDMALWGKRQDNAFYIHRLAVHPKFRHQQIGYRLLQWMDKNHALENGYIRLDCVRDNQVLNQFYKKAGYVLQGIKQLEGVTFSLYEKDFTVY